MKRLAVTGLGLVLPCGTGVEAGRLGWSEQRTCDALLPSELGSGRAARCTTFSSAGLIPPMVNRRLDRAAQLAWVASAEALASAHLNLPGEDLGIAVATMTAGSAATEAFIRPVLMEGLGTASPLLFPNTVAVAVSGHLSLAFGLRGPGTTVLGRENGLLGALDEASAWLELGLAKAVLVVGVDALFPLMLELLQRTGQSRMSLPGEGAQAFVVESLETLHARAGKAQALLTWSQVGPTNEGASARAEALRQAVAQVEREAPEAWISGASGLMVLDAAENGLAGPAPRHPKRLWGEFCGCGGQLLAAALLDSARTLRVTLPASRGCQGALWVEKG